MYDYGFVQAVRDHECICKLEGNFYYVWLNCTNIAYMHYVLHMGMEVYTCIHTCIRVNIMLPLFDEAQIWGPLEFKA